MSAQCTFSGLLVTPGCCILAGIGIGRSIIILYNRSRACCMSGRPSAHADVWARIPQVWDLITEEGVCVMLFSIVLPAVDHP